MPKISKQIHTDSRIVIVCRYTGIVIVYVKIKGQDDPIALETLSPESMDYLSDSECEDTNCEDNCKGSQLNSALMKKVPKGMTRKTSPIKGPTYRPCPGRHHTSLYEEGSELSKEIEKFKIDLKYRDGFEVG